MSYSETLSCVTIGAATSSGTQYSVLTPNNTLQLNQICIATAVFDTESMSIYLNGIFQSSGPKGTNISYNTNHTLKLGRSVPTGNTWDSAFNGTIYQVKVYNRALTAQEIQQNFNATRGRYGI